jgi:two-component system sensor histidine kinase AtoS
VDLACRRESLAAVGELAAGLAHEVRNPVAAIRGASQAMGPGSSEDQRVEMRRIIEEESERLGRFVGEFLDYARPGSPRRETVDLGRLAREAIERARLSGVETGIELEVDGTTAARGDPDQIGRAIDNLLRNACEATGGGGTVRVSLGHRAADRVYLGVADDGPGVPPGEIAKLFQPFHTTKRGGTGLGLAMVHRIVEAHGGTIDVGGRPGEGAVFTITLPSAGPEGVL